LHFCGADFSATVQLMKVQLMAQLTLVPTHEDSADESFGYS
jgi:hypothetical protein